MTGTNSTWQNSHKGNMNTHPSFQFGGGLCAKCSCSPQGSLSVPPEPAASSAAAAAPSRPSYVTTRPPAKITHVSWLLGGVNITSMKVTATNNNAHTLEKAAQAGPGFFLHMLQHGDTHSIHRPRAKPAVSCTAERVRPTRHPHRAQGSLAQPTSTENKEHEQTKNQRRPPPTNQLRVKAQYSSSLVLRGEWLELSSLGTGISRGRDLPLPPGISGTRIGRTAP
jgi:hypothetical protein